MQLKHLKGKRAIILYRCSTDRQDLETQQKECRKFCNDNGIIIVDEVEEFGVSGFKTKLADREELVKILARSDDEKDFDILVVYMFDRLGRREDETPFIIQKLSQNSVEVYSANDSMAHKAESHEDKFFNYFYSWVAQYESIKTSIRAKDAMRKRNNEGFYTGGTPPFGYEAYQTGEIKENGKVRYDLRINEKEAEIVRLIFDLAVNQNYGVYRISNYLTEHGYKNRLKIKKNKDGIRTVTECMFRSNSITRILQNPIYIGHQRWNVITCTQDKKVTNPKDEWKIKQYNEKYQIIDKETFTKVNSLMKSRKTNLTHTNISNTDINIPTKSKMLCSGLAYCSCGARLKADYAAKKYHRVTDGETTITRTNRYACHIAKNNRSIHPMPSYYSAIKYDEKVEEMLLKFIRSINVDKLTHEIEKYRENNINLLKQEIQNFYKEKEKICGVIQKLENDANEYVSVDDKDGMTFILNLVKKNNQRLSELSSIINEREKKFKEAQLEAVNLTQTQQKLSGWEERYRNQTLDGKKAMLAEIINKVVFYPNKIQLEVKIPLRNASVIDEKDVEVLETQELQDTNDTGEIVDDNNSSSHSNWSGNTHHKNEQNSANSISIWNGNTPSVAGVLKVSKSKEVRVSMLYTRIIMNKQNYGIIKIEHSFTE